jgi:hypothetical protein
VGEQMQGMLDRVVARAVGDATATAHVTSQSTVGNGPAKASVSQARLMTGLSAWPANSFHATFCPGAALSPTVQAVSGLQGHFLEQLPCRQRGPVGYSVRPPFLLTVATRWCGIPPWTRQATSKGTGCQPPPQGKERQQAALLAPESRQAMLGGAGGLALEPPQRCPADRSLLQGRQVQPLPRWS